MNTVKVQNNENKNFNYSFALLRTLMIYTIIVAHFWDIEVVADVPIYLRIFSDFKFLGVPAFMLLSFYLFQKHLEDDFKYLMKRMVRLFVPYILWAFIYFILMKITKIEGAVGFGEIYRQLKYGTSRHLNPTLWYLWDLIVITFLVSILFKLLSKDKAYFVLGILTLISFYMQYSGLNYAIFGDLIDEEKYSVGRLVEMIPYAFMGLALAETKILKIFENVKVQTLTFIAIVIVFMLRINFFSSPDNQFGYAGTQKFIISLFIFAFFVLLPLNNIPNFCKKILGFLSKYSFGVFCLHLYIGRQINYICMCKGIRYNTFTECIIIWIICYVISYLISLIPLKACKMLVC